MDEQTLSAIIRATAIRILHEDERLERLKGISELAAAIAFRLSPNPASFLKACGYSPNDIISLVDAEYKRGE